jgi:DHA3 family macrolide efflux protein-like MFS transporter
MTSEGKQQRFEMPVKRNMALIIGNNGLGVIADAIFELGVLWYVLDRTESAFITSIITTISMCIHVFAGPFIGVIVDRMNPKSALKNAYVAMGLVGIIMVVSYLFFINYIVFSILAVVVLNNLAQMFINPSITRMLPQLIGMERIAEVKGYLSTANSMASLIGNALAGFLLTMIGFVGVM